MKKLHIPESSLFVAGEYMNFGAAEKTDRFGPSMGDAPFVRGMKCLIESEGVTAGGEMRG